MPNYQIRFNNLFLISYNFNSQVFVLHDANLKKERLHHFQKKALRIFKYKLFEYLFQRRILTEAEEKELMFMLENFIQINKYLKEK